ncbi:uncharacterized protein LOC131688788 [Topomyia yanbarensis]|uniref:uncharacterized protein LOC131688788 n=1 Tax=Topomyia yanbarensis TaxID=2498891 RepID=UPI00273CBF13|nr:uncharacterized protein LOC131688788 [Topomyia yanbarensis]
MLILLNFVLVVILILLSVKLPSYTVQTGPIEEHTPNGSEPDGNLDELEDIFYKNIMEDFRTESEGQKLELTPEIKRKLDERIDGFFRVRHGTDRQPRNIWNEKRHGESRRKPRRASMQDDTVGRDRLFLKGFRERSFVPVNFPIDICMLKVGKTVFAASLSVPKTKENYVNHTVVSFYFWDRESKSFNKYMEYTAILARKFDCISHASLGFVAVVNYNDTTGKHGSPVFRILENGNTEIVQRFRQSNQNTVHMWVHGNHVYLTHTYANLNESVANVCPLYRWSVYHFDAIDLLPCYNSIHIEPFTIEQTLFLALANKMNDEAVDEDTFSDLFKFDYEQQKFHFHQKIYIYSVSHMAYIFLDSGDIREHFLVTGNSRAGKKNKAGKLDYDQHSIMYKYIDGYFVPFQKFEFYSVKRFLPVMRENGEFLLLIVCRGQPLLIYEYDGWKFIPSKIDYTRDAFADGVSHMRAYRHIVNASLIVIANRNLHGSTANIFSPIYGVENNLNKIYKEFIDWCTETTEQLATLDLEDIYKRLVKISKFEDGVGRFEKDVHIKGSTIKELRTKALHIGHTVLDQQTIDYVNKASQKLESLREKADKLKSIIDNSMELNETLEISGDVTVPLIIASDAVVKNLEATKVNDKIYKRSTNETNHVDVITVDRLVVEGQLDVQFLNGYAVDTLLHTTDDLRSLKNIDLHAPEVEVKGQLFVNHLIDGIHFTADNVMINGTHQVCADKTLRVDELTVNNLVTESLNSTSVESIMALLDEISEFRAAEQSEYPMTFKEIRVNNLEVTGLLNDMDFNDIEQHALKLEGDQNITAEFTFDKIIATNVIAPNNRLSGVDLNSMVWIKPTKDQQDFTVRQQIRFVHPVHFDKLHVHERVNHIPVIDGQLQILRQNSTEPQLITGTITFDNVVLLEPIDLQGKINSSSLRKLNTIKTISHDIHLEGAFEISGDVTVELLNATNIYGASRTYNFVDLYAHGLPLNAASSNQKFTFKQPLVAKKVFARSLNGVDPSDFISIKSDKVQKITGRKIFPGNLTLLEGRLDAAIINNVDLIHLNNTILKRTGDQVIEGNIHFKEIIVSSVVANETYFEGKPLNTLLTHSSKNTKSKVRLENSTLTILGDLNVRNLFPSEGSTIYGYDLKHMLADTLRKDSNESDPMVVTGHKRFSNLTVGELILVDQAALNGVNRENADKLDELFSKDIVIEETVILNHPIYVRNLFFNGSINGVSKEEFGSSWLLDEFNQTFTAPQYFENVIADTVIVDGYFNGIKLEELVDNLYFLDKNERIEKAIFHGGFISNQPVTVHGLVSGLNLSTDVLLDYSPEPLQLLEVRVDGNVRVTGQINIGSTLNGINYAKLKEFTSSSGFDQPLNIEIQGNAHFAFPPNVLELNGYNLQQLHRDVWMSNRDEILTGSYRFEHVHFLDKVFANGTINGLDLDEISETYLSLTKPQNVTTPLIFKSIEFRNQVSIGSIELKGLLKGTPESKGLDIVNFDKYVLKTNVEQNITGNWTFDEVEVEGDLNLTTINGLDLEKDVLLNGASNVTITGTKRFENVHANRLECPTPCIIQGVDFSEWVANSVRLDRNYTIEGVVYVENATIPGEPVHNYTFDQDHLLSKSAPQTMKENLHGETKLPARSDQGSFRIKVPVTFTQVDNVDVGDNKMFSVNLKELFQEVEYTDQLRKYESKLRNLHDVGESLVESSKTKAPYLSQYHLLKRLSGGFRTLSIITLHPTPTPLQLLVAHVDDGNRTAVEFYRWNNKDGQFRIAKGFPPISSPNLVITNCKRISLGRAQHIFVEFYNHANQYYRQSILDLEPSDLVAPKKASKFITIYEFNSTIPREMLSFRLLDLICIGLFSPHANGMEIHCLHLENMVYHMRFHQMLNTAALEQALYIDNRLITLSHDNVLQVWRSKPNYQFVLSQLVDVQQPTFITVAKFDYQLFIAVNSEHELADSSHHGSIEIWRDSQPRFRNSTFTQYQIILTKVPKQIKFSVIPSTDDLMMYTLSENSFAPLVIYRYMGVSGFREYLKSNTLRTDGKRMSVLKLDHNQRELLALVGDRETDLIEAIIKGR